MQKNVEINEDKFVMDLGTGFSLVNFDRTTELVDGRDVIRAAEQYRVKNPATYSSIVNAVVKANYKYGDDDSALRKGIVDSANPVFVEFNAFVEGVKQICRDEGIQ